MCSKAYLMVSEEMLTRLTNTNYLVGDDDRMFTESWNLWKASDCFSWRCNFRVAVFFAVYFFASSFSILFSATSMNCSTLTAVRYIPKIESGFLLDASSFTNATFFYCSIIMHYLFISWIGRTFCLLTESYAAAWRIIFLDDCCVPFARRKTIGSSVILTCT